MAELSGQVTWISSDESSFSSLNDQVAAPKYSAFGERIRHVTPHGFTCSMFCGGKQCKYCVPGKFKDNDMTITGLYSSWVTEKILAMARPSTELLKKYNIIAQFQKHGIKSIINLQLPGEHAACGFGLESGGFSYVAQEFMDNNIFFYNFGWNDYGVRSLQAILDMVKVMDFAVLTGKVAVHCHAGLGRTGVLIACYIIYSERATADEAIMKMREKRPKAIQTRGQVNCVKDFSAYIKPMWTVFNMDDKPVTLSHQMIRQRHLLHGEEARMLKHIPKIVFIICQRLLTLSDSDYDLSKCARITYSFMRNSIYNSNRKKSSTNKTENVDTPNLHKVYSTTDIDKELIKQEHLNSSLKPISEQLKAFSTPNVFLRGSETDENIHTDTRETLRNGRLKPLQKKKKKGLKDRLTQIKNTPLDEHSMLNVSLDSAFITESNDQLCNASVDSRLTQRRRSDNVSVSSFSNTGELTSSEQVLKYLAFRTTDINVLNQIERFKYKLNTKDTGWAELSKESNLGVLSGLLWSWLSQLQSPIVSFKAIELMREYIDTPEECFALLDRDAWKLIECFLTLLSQIDDKSILIERILRRFSTAMTGDETIPRVSTGAEVKDEDCSPGVVLLQFSTAWLNTLSIV